MPVFRGIGSESRQPRMRRWVYASMLDGAIVGWQMKNSPEGAQVGLRKSKSGGTVEKVRSGGTRSGAPNADSATWGTSGGISKALETSGEQSGFADRFPYTQAPSSWWPAMSGQP
ncbi:hypothetical protein [Miltoncostaea marina]|uniref:hypothetical protein n=1 Tax=Miltoncostaea marina TaxID=2843215 RepID=UPI001FE8EDA1|nr:hypothetical protein [Miltoncostaea marina]